MAGPKDCSPLEQTPVPVAKLAEAVGLYYVDIKRFGGKVHITGLSEKAIDQTSID